MEPNSKQDIASNIALALDRLSDRHVAQAFRCAYAASSGQRARDSAESVFNRLFQSTWRPDTLARFVSGWGAMHNTALFVSGLLIRILRRLPLQDRSGQTLMNNVAIETAHIIAEDTGLDGPPHSELFANFADFIVGDDRWKAGKYSVPKAEQFRQYLKAQRLSASIPDALLTTAASENWNAGEYTFLQTIVPSWLVSILRRPPELVAQKSAYIRVHAGETELAHFLHAINAWNDYCAATRTQPDPADVTRVVTAYLDHLADAFDGLNAVFTDDP